MDRNDTKHPPPPLPDWCEDTLHRARWCLMRFLPDWSWDTDDRWYDRVAVQWGADAIVGGWEARRTGRVVAEPAWTAGPAPDDLSFLVSTSTMGLLAYHAGTFRPVLSGHVFGVTRIGQIRGSGWPKAPSEAVLAYQVTGRHGRLVFLTINVTNGQLSTDTTVWGLPRGIHQIRACCDDVVLTDTYHNRLLRYSLPDLLVGIHCGGCRWTSLLRSVAYPSGRLQRGQGSTNYRHLNSLLATGDDEWLVMAHNDTRKSGRPSLIYRLDPSLAPRGVLAAGGSDCHDLSHDRAGRLLWCRSGEGLLTRDGSNVFRADGFTRGLAVGTKIILLGVCGRGPRDQRGRQLSYVQIMDVEYTPLARLRIGETQIHDICLLAETSII
jgi:hypothetical protein